MKEAKVVLIITRSTVLFCLFASMILMALPVSIKENFLDTIPYVNLAMLAITVGAFSIGSFYAKILNIPFGFSNLIAEKLKISDERMKRIVIVNTVVGMTTLILVGIFLINRFF